MVAVTKRRHRTRVADQDYDRVKKLMADTLKSMRPLPAPKLSGAYRLIADNYSELRALRQAGWTWLAIREKLNKAGITYEWQTLRRVTRRYENERGLPHAGRHHKTAATRGALNKVAPAGATNTRVKKQTKTRRGS